MPRRYPDRPFVGVGAVVWRGEEFLLARRAKPPKAGEWTLPGGVQHIGETVAETARREVAEETGLEIAVTGIAGVVDLIERDAEGRVRFHYTVIDVVAEWQAGEAVAADDVDAVAWVRPAALPAYGASSETIRIVEMAAAKRRK